MRGGGGGDVVGVNARGINLTSIKCHVSDKKWEVQFNSLQCVIVEPIQIKYG